MKQLQFPIAAGFYPLHLTPSCQSNPMQIKWREALKITVRKPLSTLDSSGGWAPKQWSDSTSKSFWRDFYTKRQCEHGKPLQLSQFEQQICQPSTRCCNIEQHLHCGKFSSDTPTRPLLQDTDRKVLQKSYAIKRQLGKFCSGVSRQECETSCHDFGGLRENHK